MLTAPPILGWAPAGPGRIEPAPGGPPLEDPKSVICWRCTDGGLWVEESRCPPEKLQVLKQLAVFLATNGYLVAVLNATPTKTVLLSRHERLVYNITPIPMPAVLGRDWMLAQGK